MPYEIKGELDCWEWTGRTDDHGTPTIRTPTKHTTARRYYWERAHETPVPEGKILYAMCRNPLCVRPLHAEPVSRSEFAYRVGVSKLDPRRAAFALGLRRTGMSRRQVALHFGVDPETIHAVENGTHWTQRKAAA